MSVKGIVNMVVLCAWLSWTQIPKSKMNYKYDWLCAWLPDSRTQTPVRDALLNQELSKQRWQESKLDGINNQISIHVSKMNCKHDWLCGWLSDSRTQTPARDALLPVNQELSKQRQQESKLDGISNQISIHVSKMNCKHDWSCGWLSDSRTQTPARDALLNQELSKQRWQESKLDGINNQISIHVSKMNCKHDWSCAWLSDSRTQTPTRDPLINQELSKQRRQEHKLTGINNKIFPISLTTKACNRV